MKNFFAFRENVCSNQFYLKGVTLRKTNFFDAFLNALYQKTGKNPKNHK